MPPYFLPPAARGALFEKTAPCSIRKNFLLIFFCNFKASPLFLVAVCRVVYLCVLNLMMDFGLNQGLKKTAK